MRGFIKILIAFIYIFLAIFIQPNNIYAFENLSLNAPKQYIISSSKPDAVLINNKNEENYTIFQNRSRLEITNQSNKNDNLSSGNIDKAITDYNISNNSKTENIICPILITDNVSSILKNTIYTRAP